MNIHNYLPAFRKTCNDKVILEGAKMGLSKFFFKKNTKASIYARTTTVDKKRRAKDGQLKPYGMVVKYLLRTYATEYIISKTDAEINR